MKHKHKISEIDEDLMTATCTTCGENAKIYRKKNRTGNYGFRCWIAKQEQRGVRTNWPSHNDPVYKYKYTDGIVKLKRSDREDFLKKFNGCAICGRDDVPLVVDHCHSVGTLRGALCTNCNTGIGFFKDNVELLKNAINYLS